MAKARRQSNSNNYVTLGFRVLILVIIALLLANSARKKLEKVVTEEQFPTAAEQYTQLKEQKGSIRALAAMLTGKGESADDTDDSRLSKRLNGAPEIASVKLRAEVKSAEEAEKSVTELIDVEGRYFRGKLLRITDPSRVFIGVSGKLGGEEPGKKIEDIVKKYGAVAGVNASGFDDPNGLGNGGTPLGLVISQGEWQFGYDWMTYEVIGFDKKNKLHCSYMTGRQARELGLRDAASFGPILISDGSKVNNANRQDGHNPRTVIGQTDDGTVLLLVIEGRQISSLGATCDEAAEIMLKYGAVNAGNMDGGASAVMICNGEQITLSSSLNGSRAVPDAWLIAPEQ
ncbi:MAG: phosphodiester glycosidase family protein [Oscillospiraceae bacterium]|nr:phosphodiester glycosidase family protein [Oscillospiraceae bacterium]